MAASSRGTLGTVLAESAARQEAEKEGKILAEVKVRGQASSWIETQEHGYWS